MGDDSIDKIRLRYVTKTFWRQIIYCMQGSRCRKVMQITVNHISKLKGFLLHYAPYWYVYSGGSKGGWLDPSPLSLPPSNEN